MEEWGEKGRVESGRARWGFSCVPLPPPYDVAIVGLGPVGAALAAHLGQRGLRVLALEREAAPHSLPRAAHLDGHALRALAEAGVEVEGRPLDGFDLVDRYGRLLLRGRPREAPPTGFPSGLLVHQPTVERTLRRRLATLPDVEVRLGHAVERVEDVGDGVVVSGVGPGGPFRGGAALAVGCDGARSLVREAVGADLRGSGFDQSWLVVDVLLRPDVGVAGVEAQHPGRPGDHRVLVAWPAFRFVHDDPAGRAVYQAALAPCQQVPRLAAQERVLCA